MAEPISTTIPEVGHAVRFRNGLATVRAVEPYESRDAQGRLHIVEVEYLDDCLGVVVLRNVGDDAPPGFVTVIDCRGTKLARRFFTRWHEVAHRLTTHADQGATESAYRSGYDPIERMMDETVAGHVGLYEPPSYSLWGRYL